MTVIQLLIVITIWWALPYCWFGHSNSELYCSHYSFCWLHSWWFSLIFGDITIHRYYLLRVNAFLPVIVICLLMPVIMIVIPLFSCSMTLIRWATCGNCRPNTNYHNNRWHCQLFCYWYWRPTDSWYHYYWCCYWLTNWRMTDSDDGIVWHYWADEPPTWWPDIDILMPTDIRYLFCYYDYQLWCHSDCAIVLVWHLLLLTRLLRYWFSIDDVGGLPFIRCILPHDTTCNIHRWLTFWLTIVERCDTYYIYYLLYTFCSVMTSIVIQELFIILLFGDISTVFLIYQPIGGCYSYCCYYRWHCALTCILTGICYCWWR